MKERAKKHMLITNGKLIAGPVVAMSLVDFSGFVNKKPFIKPLMVNHANPLGIGMPSLRFTRSWIK